MKESFKMEIKKQPTKKREMKHEVNIAFDVASNLTGYAMILNKHYEMSGVINTSHYKNTTDTKWKQKALTIDLALNELFWHLRNKVPENEGIKINIIFEYNEHGFFSTTKKLMLAIGMYMAICSSKTFLLFAGDLRDMDFKLISAAEWQSKIRQRNKQLAGEYTKQHSVDFANHLLKETYKIKNEMPISSDDEAEAIIMAHFGNKLRSKSEVREGIKNCARELKRIRKAKAKSNLMIKKYKAIQKEKAKAGKNLTKAEREMLDKHELNIISLNNEIKELQKNKIWAD